MFTEEMKKYFPFSDNILAINCIKSDIQDRANGCDEDSDFCNKHIGMQKYVEEYHS